MDSWLGMFRIALLWNQVCWFLYSVHGMIIVFVLEARLNSALRNVFVRFSC